MSTLFGNWELWGNLIAICFGLLVIIKNNDAAVSGFNYQQFMAKKLGQELDPKYFNLRFFKVGFYIVGLMSIVRGILNLMPR